jgi:curved DNA-binding protein CbpA
MSDPYAVLGVPEEADDEAIRQRYLELVRQFPPEQHPERFAAVRAAYERLRDVDRRVRLRLYDQGRYETIDALIEEIGCQTPRPRFRLKDLIAAARPGR